LVQTGTVVVGAAQATASRALACGRPAPHLINDAKPSTALQIMYSSQAACKDRARARAQSSSVENTRVRAPCLFYLHASASNKEYIPKDELLTSLCRCLLT
jgi:hypothetical protein